MDMIRLRISYAFIRARTRLSWREVRFGLDNALLDPYAAVERAMEEVEELDQPSLVLLELAAAGRRDPVRDLVDPLASAEPAGSDDSIRDKWLYLVLAWIWEHRAEDPNPLERVDYVYADFDYPEALAAFVRWMPMQGPDLGSREANEQRLFQRWKEYLDATAPLYAP